MSDEEFNIGKIKETIEKNFSNLWSVVETCLSVTATLKIFDLKDPVGLILIDDPSSEKTTVISMFYSSSIVYRSDDFTPKAFVTGANVTAEKAKEIDMLPRINGKCLAIPELAPIFGKRKEDRLENLSILTRVFDGQGFVKDFGSVGRRGYEEPIIFCMLGATTPLNYEIWKDMTRLGTRLFFLNMNTKKNKTPQQLMEEVFLSESYHKKLKECNHAILMFLSKLFSDGIKTILWDKQKDDKESLLLITELAELLTKLRSPIQLWKGETDEEKDYQYFIPMKERPYRAMQILYNIARGHAILYGRNYVTNDDIKILIPIVFSSMPDDRRRMWQLLVENNGYLDYVTVIHSIGMSKPQAYRIMKLLALLDVADYSGGDSEDEYDPQRKHLKIKSKYQSLLDKIKSIQRHSDDTSHQTDDTDNV